MRLTCALAASTFGAMLAAASVGIAPAQAHDGSNTPTLGYVSQTDNFLPMGANDQAYNGVKVYLSSPRHTDSGSRGECKNPGKHENVNGRRWNKIAANGNHYGTNHDPAFSLRNLHGRGYKVMVSPNTRKSSGYLDNRNLSRNWGAKVHIVTHSNANTGCNQPTKYFLTMWKDDNDARDDKDLASGIKSYLGGPTPGTAKMWRSTGLAELSTGAQYGDAYVELAFHDNRASQKWLNNKTLYNAYRYGVAVDNYLNYP